MQVENGGGIGNEVCGMAAAQEYVLSAIPGIVRAVMKETDVSERKRKQPGEMKYKAMRDALKGLFEQYRESEPGGALRAVIDMLLAADMKCAPLNDDAFKKRHNAVVLRYITEKPMSDKEICKRLKIQAWTLEDKIDIAIGDMMPSFYGVDILDVLP